jgi:hypothetical protein
MNKIEEFIRKFKQSQSQPIDQLNALTSAREEIDKLIKEIAKKVK